jgi:hypothetical protein
MILPAQCEQFGASLGFARLTPRSRGISRAGTPRERNTRLTKPGRRSPKINCNLMNKEQINHRRNLLT